MLVFSAIYANLNSESYHSLIGFHTPEYLVFLKLQVVPRFTGTCISLVNRNWGILTSLIFAFLTNIKFDQKLSDFVGHFSISF
jgi:hypothetical protein